MRIVGSRSQRLLAREDRRLAEAVLAGEQVVDLQPEPVERRLPPVVVRDDERQVADEVRRVLAQDAALLQRLHDERDVALLEIAHAAVHQLRAAARGALAEVALLEQQHGVAARRGVDGDARAGRAAADDDEVPRAPCMALHARAHLVAVHAPPPTAGAGGIQPFDRLTASRQRSRSRIGIGSRPSRARNGARPATARRSLQAMTRSPPQAPRDTRHRAPWSP